jgi:hypothetical protein
VVPVAVLAFSLVMWVKVFNLTVAANASGVSAGGDKLRGESECEFGGGAVAGAACATGAVGSGNSEDGYGNQGGAQEHLFASLQPLYRLLGPFHPDSMRPRDSLCEYPTTSNMGSDGLGADDAGYARRRPGGRLP